MAILPRLSAALLGRLAATVAQQRERGERGGRAASRLRLQVSMAAPPKISSERDRAAVGRSSAPDGPRRRRARRRVAANENRPFWRRLPLLLLALLRRASA